MASKKVTFPNGKMVTVYSVPQKYYDEILAAFPDPPVPILEDNRTATGEPLLFENRKDPAYVSLCEERQRKRNRKWLERLMLRGLKEVRPPKDWRVSDEQIAETRYLLENSDWQPRQGEIGQALDYIEYEFFESPADATFLMRTVNELSGVPIEVADAIEDTFQGDLEVQGEGKEQEGNSD